MEKDEQSIQESATGLLAVLERELMKAGYFMSFKQSNYFIAYMEEALGEIAKLPGCKRRGLGVEWHKVITRKGKTIDLGLSYTSIFAVRLLVECMVRFSQEKIAIGVAHYYATLFEDSIPTKDWNYLLEESTTMVKLGRVIEDLKVVIEALNINQTRAVRGTYVSFQYNAKMGNDKHLPKKDIMTMSILLVIPMLKALHGAGVLKEASTSLYNILKQKSYA